MNSFKPQCSYWITNVKKLERSIFTLITENSMLKSASVKELCLLGYFKPDELIEQQV